MIVGRLIYDGLQVYAVGRATRSKAARVQPIYQPTAVHGPSRIAGPGPGADGRARPGRPAGPGEGRCQTLHHSLTCATSQTAPQTDLVGGAVPSQALGETPLA